MTPAAISNDVATLCDMKKQDVPAFTHKLRRVLGDASRTDFADKIGVKPGTLRAWLSQGNIPPTELFGLIAENAGCSVAYLCDDRIPVNASPQATVDLTRLPDEAILGELKKRLGATALQLEDLVNRAEGYPWESVAAWLLSSFMPPSPESDFVLAGLKLFKDIEPKAARFRLIGGEAAQSGGFVTAWNGGTPIPIDLDALINRLDKLRDLHPGIVAISYYLHYFDEEWCVGMYGKKELKPTPDWDDRRAWLMAQLVAHEDLKDESIYEPIRARLREMNYIDAEGKSRDYGYSKIGMGDFDLPEPGWET